MAYLVFIPMKFPGSLDCFSLFLSGLFMISLLNIYMYTKVTGMLLGKKFVEICTTIK